jgi:serine/threonine protein kinase/tetratricopeptide (TPR) repeat protein
LQRSTPPFEDSPRCRRRGSRRPRTRRKANGPTRSRCLAPGERIGRFQLVRELGRGGFGVVWEANDLDLGRSVAFKAVRPGRPRLRGQQLLREADTIARLSHPNLVTLYDVGRCEHGPYLVLELLRGMTLAQRLAHGDMGTAEALRVAIEVARALEHAHGQGVVHRDLKPSNVFLCEGGLVKVLDFGMAHAFGLERVAGGTPSYMAPEQARDAPEDERTDIFALGVILYRMLAGELPFGEGGQELETSRAAPPLEAPAAPALGSFVARMLEKDPVKRPRRVSEVIAALTSFHEELERTGSTGTVTRVRRRRRRLWGVAALLAAGAILGAGAAALVARRSLSAGRPGEVPCVAVLPLSSLSSSQDDRFLADGIHSEIITQLAKISGLRVIARSSVQPYRDSARELGDIARSLGAGTLLEGTVQREGTRVRVAVHLVDPGTRQEIWADRFDRDQADVFAIQTEVALEIARTLGAKITAAERRRVERPPTRDREAYDLYLRAVFYWERSMGIESDNRTAEELFSRAVRQDPSFALAHAELSIVESESASSPEECAVARGHAERALELEPDLPRAHAALGTYHRYCGKDVRAALREYEIAVDGAPGDAIARSTLGTLRMLVGRLDEGLAELQAALALDPRSYWVSDDLVRELAGMRRFDEAARVCERMRDIAPSDLHARAYCALIPVWRYGDLGPASRVLAGLPRELPSSGVGAWSLVQLLSLFPERTLEVLATGRVADPFSSASPFIPRDYIAGCAHAALGHRQLAVAAFRAALGPLEARVRSVPDESFPRLYLGRAYAGLGRADEALSEARRALALAREEHEKSGLLGFAAQVAAAAGRRAEAFEWLGAALSRRDGLLTPASVRVDPRFAALRDDPRFAALVGEGPARAMR